MCVQGASSRHGPRGGLLHLLQPGLLLPGLLQVQLYVHIYIYRYIHSYIHTYIYYLLIVLCVLCIHTYVTARADSVLFCSVYVLFVRMCYGGSDKGTVHIFSLTDSVQNGSGPGAAETSNSSSSGATTTGAGASSVMPPPPPAAAAGSNTNTSAGAGASGAAQVRSANCRGALIYVS